MNRIDRLSAILIQLQSKKVVKAQEIADRFDISLRTVYRDVRALEEAGIPIGAEAGVGYFLMEGYNLPPVKFSKEEAGSLLMASKLAEKLTDKSINKHLNDALFKIRAALKLEEKDYLESIENSIEVIHLPKGVKNASFPDHFLTELQNALADKKVVNFDYFSNYNAAFTNRDVEPLSLCFYSGHWHLIGYCQLRNALRDFRSDRIMKLAVTEKLFDHTRHVDYKDYITSITQGTELEEILVRFNHQVARYVGEQKYYMGYVDSVKTDEYEEMKFLTAANPETFAHWLLQFCDQVTIVAPEKLKNAVVSLVKRACLHYGVSDQPKIPHS